MGERYIENTYHDVASLINQFIQVDPQDGMPLLDSLNNVHDIPEIGEVIFEEEKEDINKIITILKSKADLSEQEASVLSEALIILNDIECKIAYGSGLDRTNANHTINYNFEHLRGLSNDEIYQKSLAFAEVNLKELFKHRLGTRPGTVIFHNAMDVLFSFYSYASLLEEFTSNDMQLIETLIYDIAQNINKDACRYLTNKHENFAKFRTE